MNGWYLEIYDAAGQRILAEDGQNFESVKRAVDERNRLGSGTVRFIAPHETPEYQIELLKSLGATPT